MPHPKQMNKTNCAKNEEGRSVNNTNLPLLYKVTAFSYSDIYVVLGWYVEASTGSTDCLFTGYPAEPLSCDGRGVQGFIACLLCVWFTISIKMC